MKKAVTSVAWKGTKEMFCRRPQTRWWDIWIKTQNMLHSKQKDHIHPKENRGNTPLLSLPLPHSLSCYLASPLICSLLHINLTNTHTHRRILPFGFPMWFCGTDAGSTAEIEKGVKQCLPLYEATGSCRWC